MSAPLGTTKPAWRRTLVVKRPLSADGYNHPHRTQMGRT
jgi:hypothetical protein